MDRLISFFLMSVLFFGCESQIEKIESYYDSGEVRTKLIYDNSSDTLNYKIINYYETGQILGTADVINGNIEGILITYNRDRKIIGNTMYINNQKNGFWTLYNGDGSIKKQEFYQNDSLFLTYNFVKDVGYEVMMETKHGQKRMGYVYLDSLNNPIKDESRFYQIYSKDTIKYDDVYNMEVEVFYENKPDRNFELTVFNGKLNSGTAGKNDSIIILPIENSKVSYSCKPLKKGWNLLMGVVTVYGPNKQIETEFLLHKEFFVTP